MCDLVGAVYIVFAISVDCDVPGDSTVHINTTISFTWEYARVLKGNSLYKAIYTESLYLAAFVKDYRVQYHHKSASRYLNNADDDTSFIIEKTEDT